MTPPTVDAGTRFAFAPYEVPIDGLLYCVYIVFESSRGDLFCVRTQLMSVTLEAADNMCDALNSQLHLSREQWKFFASEVFATVEMEAREKAESKNSGATPKEAIAPDDLDDADVPW